MKQRTTTTDEVIAHELDDEVRPILADETPSNAYDALWSAVELAGVNLSEYSHGDYIGRATVDVDTGAVIAFNQGPADGTHYTELRAIYVDMIHRHQKLKADEGSDSPRAAELIQAVLKLENLLNEWNNRDDRDGHPEADQ